MERVIIIPFGAVDSEALGTIAAGLREAFGSDAVIGAPAPVPAPAYHPGRRQYRSTSLLHLLESFSAGGRDIVLGVIDRDLYAPDLHFVFGEADPVSRTAVVSLARLRQEFYGRRQDRARFLQRAAKEAVHEIGHTVGFGHCPDPRCIMHFSNCLADTDRTGPGFCERHGRTAAETA